MAESQPNQQTSQAGELVDKDHLYGRFYKGEDRKARIYERSVMQSLDLADDEMNVDTRVDKSRQGLGAGAALSSAAAVGVPPSLILAGVAWHFAHRDEQPPAPPTQPAAVQTIDTDTDSGLYLLDEPPEPTQQGQQ